MTMFALLNPARDRERVSRIDRERVNPMIDGCMTFGEVEDVIERVDLPDEQKSALWLLAFSRLDPQNQQRIAEDAWVGAVRGLLSEPDPRF